jgi:SAM-dependent methyltransferase
VRTDDDDDDDDDADADADGGDRAAAAIFAEPCAAFCRGHLGLDPSTRDEDAIAAGRSAGLRLHRFKRARTLPRVQRIVSTLHGLAPESVLDIGTGRGVMLWPLLEAVPDVPITCVDVRADRVADLAAVARGGISRLRAVHGAAEDLPLADKCVDVAIASEVLEHVANAHAAAASLVRVARRFIVVTVPSQPDDNPEHVRLFTADSLRALFRGAGAARINIDGVRGHFVAVITC